jgi:L-ascorbate metabolism protein UlaG (beta-lactamase superfamily)
MPAYTLRKTRGPALAASDLGRIDVVLLSHDHHPDNLDHAGLALLPGAGRVLTTREGAKRLGDDATGLAPWETVEVAGPDGAVLRVIATPARHGPADGDRGPVVGFACAFADAPAPVVYFSGDTVWYEGVREVAERFGVDVALLCAGAARVRAAGDHPLTLTAKDAVAVARAMPSALVVPVHYEGWEHFSESRDDVERAFADVGLADRLRWLEPGTPTQL